MTFTQVTITHDFDLPDTSGALGTVEFAPAEAMHNGAKTVSGTRRATLGAGGVLSQALDATTDPGTSPPGVPYRIVVRLLGQPPQTFYAPLPHNQGSTLDLAVLLAWANGGSVGGGPATVTLTPSAGVITPNAALGSAFRYIATADVQLASPTGGSESQQITVRVKASGADRVLSFPTGASVTIPSGTWWVGRLLYDATDDAWLADF